MTYSEVLANARECIGKYCKACPVCNGVACKNQIPGPGAKGSGTVAVRKTPAAIADPLFAELPEVFHAQAVHRQSAVRLPPGAECLARNDFEPHHAFRVGEAAWGVQFHPEFDAFAMRGYIRHLADALRSDGADPEALARTVIDTPAAAAILARFGRFVMERAVGVRA
jgi:GMP synthase (glutamine-hydrolysing)